MVYEITGESGKIKLDKYMGVGYNTPIVNKHWRK
jgi:hypothetical protein